MSKHISSHTHTQGQLDHHANQMNPNSSAHQAAMNNHANQLNPNNGNYAGSGGAANSHK